MQNPALTVSFLLFAIFTSPMMGVAQANTAQEATAISLPRSGLTTQDQQPSAIEPELIPSNNKTAGSNNAEPTNTSVTNDRHQACLAAVEADPQTGREQAERWVRDAGGPYAMHCYAMADLAIGLPKLAALKLQQLAEQDNVGDTTSRARIFAQSAEIWLSANQPEAAAEALAQAFSLAPDAGELLLLSGSINHHQKRWGAVIDAITKAEEQGFFIAEGYVMRARAYKEISQNDDAAEDVARALRIDPFNLDALVLRGELAQLGIFINTNFRRAGTEPTPVAEKEKTPIFEIPDQSPAAILPGEVDLTTPPPPQ